MSRRLEGMEFENKGALVYAHLSSALIRGRLLPGERLKIRQLAQSMGTSVTPVRDAILRLVQDGVLVLLSPRDIRVPELSLAAYLEIRQIRIELEGIAAARAAQIATEKDVQYLRGLLGRHEQELAARQRDQAIATNQDFHFAMCRIAQMPQLAEILRRLWMMVGPLIAQCYDEVGRDIVAHHYPAVEAVARGDSQAAKIAMQNDILLGGQAMLLHVERHTLPASETNASAIIA